jgi:hypothetical protein
MVVGRDRRSDRHSRCLVHVQLQGRPPQHPEDHRVRSGQEGRLARLGGAAQLRPGQGRVEWHRDRLRDQQQERTDRGSLHSPRSRSSLRVLRRLLGRLGLLRRRQPAHPHHDRKRAAQPEGPSVAGCCCSILAPSPPHSLQTGRHAVRRIICRGIPKALWHLCR